MAGLLAQGAVAAEPDPRIAKEIEAAVMRLADMGALDQVDASQPLVVQQEARMRYELGAVVRVERGVQESPVLAITPGGYAERMGLKVGDRVLAINGVVLSRSDDPGRDFAAAIGRSNGRLQMQVLRGRETLELAQDIEAVEVPGFRIEISQPLRHFRESRESASSRQ
jgi:predicted metalloprotease with PDZ domain